MGLTFFSCGGKVQEDAIDRESVHHILSQDGKALQIKESEAGEMAQQLRALAALPQVPDSILNAHVVHHHS